MLPADLNGLVRFAEKTKSRFCACAITFQTQSTSFKSLCPEVSGFPFSFDNIPRFPAVSLNTAKKKEAFGLSPVTEEASRLGPCDLSTSVGNIHPTGRSGSLELELSRSHTHARTPARTHRRKMMMS